jgi:transcription antitermination protein NusB
MQARRIARELALLSAGQLPNKPQKIAEKDLASVIAAAIRSLTSEVQDSLETAATELQRSRDACLGSEIRAATLETARDMLNDAISLTQTAINRLGAALELPEFIYTANQPAVQGFAMELLTTVAKHRTEVDAVINEALVDWQTSRLARIDLDILRIAVTEMIYLEQPDRVAINEAVELAKRYSGDDGYRFINGVLRRVVEQRRTPISSASANSEASDAISD